MSDPTTFDERFAAIRYAQPTRATERFTREEVASYVAAKARLPLDFALPYADVLRLFPPDWWRDAIVEVLRARPDAGGARAFVKALLEVDPAYFDAAPHELLGWGVGFARTMRALQARPEVARAGLRDVYAASQDRRRWDAAVYLALLESAEEPWLAAELRALGEPDASTNRAALVAHDRVGELGFALRDGELRRHWPRATHHLAFPAGHFGPRTRPALEAPPGEPLPTSFAFGGAVEGRGPGGASVQLAHVLTLDPPPPGLGVTLPRLVLAVSRALLEGDGSPRFYRHLPDGTVACDDASLGEHPPFRAASVRLVRTPAALAFQAWSEEDENLFRLGGLPVFVQSPSYPACPDCGATMLHILGLDSGLPLEGAHQGATEHWWGSGGTANGFWCDACRTSAWTWQCS